MFCKNHPYRSHLIGFADLARAALPHVTFVAHAHEAQVALLYGAANDIAAWLVDMPQLQQLYRIGHIVWEADRLVPAAQLGVRRLHEVWTPSHYCRATFSQYHARVYRLPHVCAPPGPVSAAAHADIAALLGVNAAATTLLSIGTDDLRKNYAVLVTAFAQVRRQKPHIRLILKHNPTATHKGVYTTPDGITRIYDNLTAEQIDALYAHANIYVSAHHSEGWGLTLSQAMARGRITVAPAHGGNLDYMTPDNSILVPAHTAPIGANDMAHWFLPDMQWGHCSVDDLAAGMHAALAQVAAPQGEGLARQAIDDVAQYSAAAMQHAMQAHFARIGRALLQASDAGGEPNGGHDQGEQKP